MIVGDGNDTGGHRENMILSVERILEGIVSWVKNKFPEIIGKIDSFKWNATLNLREWSTVTFNWNNNNGEITIKITAKNVECILDLWRPYIVNTVKYGNELVYPLPWQKAVDKWDEDDWDEYLPIGNSREIWDSVSRFRNKLFH